jgi:L-lactate dehydrogenase complex protein LldF
MSAHFTLDDESLRSRTATAVTDERLRRSLANAVGRFSGGRELALGALADPDELRHAARRMRHEILAELPRIVERFAAEAERRGVVVHWALDAAAANRIITSIAESSGAVRIVKGKSMASEETGVNDALAAVGAEVVETDLGEWILQLGGQTPSHIIAPAVHLDRHQVRDILQPAAPAGEILPTDPEGLAAFARRTLRQRFLDADLGVTGCNVAVAETGSIVLVENEGNGRMSTTLPRVHIALMGVERIVETWEQLDLTVNLLARSGTGQALTTYTNVITGPRRDEADGPDAVHVVILDNGRSELLGTEFEEALNCIRCGACLNVCPVYRQIGGHAYGWVYSGPIGAVLTPLLAHEHENADELATASTLCGACMDACPVEIPLQDLLLSLRRRRAADAERTEKAAWRAWSVAWSRPTTYRASMRALALGRPLRRLATGLPGGSQWSAGRSLPEPARRSFTEQWKAGEV